MGRVTKEFNLAHVIFNASRLAHSTTTEPRGLYTPAKIPSVASHYCLTVRRNKVG